MASKYHQIALSDIFSDCQNILIDDSPSFFELLSDHMSLQEFIPAEFYSAFYLSLGRNRTYSLHGFLTAFILQKIFSIPTDSLLLLFLHLCKELRDFCGFTKVPDASLLSRFKHDFEPYIELMFQRMVDDTEPICQLIDASALPPVLKDFFSLHPDFHPDTFLGDSAFDSADLYGILMNDFHFSKALIPYNKRNESTLKVVGYNAYGYPTCPKDPSLDMNYCGVTKEKGRADRIKWLCPKMHYHKGWICDCEEPCSIAKNGRTTYTYENMDLRMFPGIQRDSDGWNDTYKIRTIVERAINHFKINMCIAGRKTRNHITTKADLFFAGIASQLTVIVAYTMSCPQYVRSLKPLVA